MNICYQRKRFSVESATMIHQANEIIEEYEAQGFVLTLRQLYYQFVARDMISNTMRSYKRLGSVVNNGRLAGLISWEAIEDRTRNLYRLPFWHDVGHLLEDDANHHYRIDRWANQLARPEVWIEKEALVGVIHDVCVELDVPYFACRGYVSQSEQWRAGRRFRETIRRGQTPVVLHFGDHDPSGIDMTRDNGDRLQMFAEAGVEVQRLALNMEQVEDYGPPPNPAKMTDSRFEGYAAEYGDESWELDALEPATIVDLIRTNVEDLTDTALWEDSDTEQEEGRQLLIRMSENLDAVEQFLDQEGL